VAPGAAAESAAEAKLCCPARNDRSGDVDQLEAMRVFVAVAERGSLTSAARALGMPVASVSRKLTALEAQLGAKLLARSTRRTALSDPGRRYLEACRDVLARVEEAGRAVGEGAAGAQGELAISAPVAFGRLHVLPIVTEFLERHPKLHVRFQLVDRIAQLIDEGVDVAVRIAALPDSSLIAQRVGAIRLICCASPAYLQRHGTPQRPDDLAAHACIAAAGLTGRARWSFPRGRAMRRVPVNLRLEVTTAEAAVDAACAGVGIARVLSYQAATALGDGRLRRILADCEPAATPVHVVHADGRTPRPVVREFAALAATRLRAALRN
jgi:DNA-binding transcriptional LysR family regulator